MKKREKTILIAAIIFVLGFFVKQINLNAWIALMIISYFIVGKNVLLKAFRNIKQGEFFDENFLMSIATLGAIIIGEMSEAVAVMLFYEIGELFQSYAVSKSRKSISEVMDIKPKYANLYEGNSTKQVVPYDVKIGDIIEIRVGERVPLDSVIIKGEMSLDMSALTGESLPIEVKENSRILSGAININGIALAKVYKEYRDSTVNKILDLVENAAIRKSKSERLITRFSKVYTPIVVFTAILLAVLPPFIFKNGSFQEWLIRALTFLVVSCPCAFVISVPMTFFSGIGAASSSGILIKGGNYLESLAKLQTVILDKTGTLTKGSFNIQKIILLNNKIQEEEFIKLVAHAESISNHPISKSILKHYKKEIDKKIITSIEEISGKGVKATINNKQILVGNSKLVDVPSNINVDEIGTTLYVSIDNEFYGYIVIADELKKDSNILVDKLKKIGIRDVIMLTGDSNKIAEKVAKDINIDSFFAELLPADKVNKFEEIIKNSKGKVAFIGDGINDAPVIARADIGIAMGAIGSDAAIEAADVVIMTDELMKLPLAIKIARKTIKIAFQNITLAFSVKFVALILSAFGFATMWEAVFADVGITILAVLNSLRALKVDK